MCVFDTNISFFLYSNETAKAIQVHFNDFALQNVSKANRSALKSTKCEKSIENVSLRLRTKNGD